MERRVQHALELLRDRDRTIAEIAHAAGLSSQSHLTANFRRVIGLTPGRFRRSRLTVDGAVRQLRKAVAKQAREAGAQENPSRGRGNP